jgi:hypothetical protein
VPQFGLAPVAGIPFEALQPAHHQPHAGTLASQAMINMYTAICHR